MDRLKSIQKSKFETYIRMVEGTGSKFFTMDVESFLPPDYAQFIPSSIHPVEILEGLFSRRENENYLDFIDRTLGLNIHERVWLFSNLWVKSDNTKEGFLRRCKYFIENGLPEEWEFLSPNFGN